MRLLSLIALGAASVSASPDAVDEILRKLSANSSNDTASSNAGGSGGSSNDTASSNAGGGGNTTASASAQGSASASASASAAATTVAVASNTTVAPVTTVAANTTVAPVETTVAAAVTTVAATNGTGSNSTNTTDVAKVKQTIASATVVTMTVPDEILNNQEKLGELEAVLGNAFGDVVCDGISQDKGVSASEAIFTKYADCKCSTAPSGGKTKNAAGTHTCSAKYKSSRRAQATRRLAAGAKFDTSSEVKAEMNAQQVAKAEKLATATKATMTTDVADALKDRLAATDAPAGLKAIAANLTDSLQAEKATAKGTKDPPTPAATAGAVAAASAGFGLLIAALLF